MIPAIIDKAFLDFYKVEGKLEGLPFAIFPSATYLNLDLFKEAGLNSAAAEGGREV